VNKDALASPLSLLLALMIALVVGLWLSALNTRYQDVGHTVPFLIQVWMYASNQGTWSIASQKVRSKEKQKRMTADD